jgi:hypothetical protein
MKGHREGEVQAVDRDGGLHGGSWRNAELKDPRDLAHLRIPDAVSTVGYTTWGSDFGNLSTLSIQGGCHRLGYILQHHVGLQKHTHSTIQGVAPENTFDCLTKPPKSCARVKH